jgi:hypothetical protein
MEKCKKNHDLAVLGRNNQGACIACKRAASAKYAAARKAGVPLQENKRQARTDLGYDEIGDHSE